MKRSERRGACCEPPWPSRRVAPRGAPEASSGEGAQRGEVAQQAGLLGARFQRASQFQRAFRLDVAVGAAAVAPRGAAVAPAARLREPAILTPFEAWLWGARRAAGRTSASQRASTVRVVRAAQSRAVWDGATRQAPKATDGTTASLRRWPTGARIVGDAARQASGQMISWA